MELKTLWQEIKPEIKDNDLLLDPHHHRRLYTLLLRADEIYHNARELRIDFTAEIPQPFPMSDPTVWYENVFWIRGPVTPKFHYLEDFTCGITISTEAVDLNGETSSLILTINAIKPHESPQKARLRVYEGPLSRLNEVPLRGRQQDIQNLMSNWNLEPLNNMPFVLTGDL